MSDRNRKEQLGVRLTPGIRARCLQAAEKAGRSLNEWVENVLLNALGDISTPIVPHPDQIPIAVDDTLPPGTVQLQHDGETVAELRNVDKTLKAFDPACRNRAYHWQRGPGNPCRFCGGET